ncbi:MAG: leucine-rich repeat domain-containing protein, partial [Bacteroidales bacterium]|nr:leucine-rich repeat domain-containing protein [Bacteroidales bacterium]
MAAIDITDEEQHLYYTITNDEEGNRTVKVTYPNTSASYATYAYGTYGSYITKPSGEVSIPSAINHNDRSYTVNEIDKWTFSYCSDITSITIPNSIVAIGDNAFKGCTGLTNVYFNAKNVTASPTTSSNSAFNSTTCTNACTLTIGPDVEYIPTYVLYGLSNVSIINYNATECADFTSSDYLNIWPTMASGCILNIGDNVTKIPAYAFRQKSSLSSINMGNSVVTIGDYAFSFSSKSTNITGEITLPETLTTIGEYAFQNCAGTTFNWPSNITSIGRQAFYYCEKLATVVINNDISEIPECTFQGCIGLTTLTIGTGVKTIGNNAFQGCTGLTNITLNATLTTVPSSSNYAFKSCTCANACTLTIGTEVSSIPTNTFNCLGNVLTIYFNATSCADFESTNSSMPSVPSSGTFASVYIGDNVTRVPSYMFKGKKLSHITIGSSVSYIGYEAFSAYGTITSELISKPSTPPTLETNTFQNGNKSNPTYVPSGSVSAYQTATGWSSFSNYKSIYEIAGSITILTEGTYNSDILSITGEGSITVNNNGMLNCDYIWGSTPENLILNDSAQLICKNSVAATWNKTITNAGAKDVKDHWYTITSPVHEGTNNYITISNTNTVNLTAANYDMFAYDEAGTWLNQKAGSGAAGFTTMEVGKGYLYRNSGNQLSFVGNTTVGKQTVNLKKTGTSNISGLNFIANPFSHNIYLGDGGAIDNDNLVDNFYYISDRGTWQIGTYETPIIPGRGIIVQTDSDNVDLDILDKTTSANPPSKASATELQFILNSNQYQDIAYAVLNEGYGLSKLEHPNEAAPMLFINHNDKNYAVAHMNSNTRSFNLGLSAKSFGQYTLKYKAKGNVKYLHVIDRLTGNDVDMLLEGEYSFIASPTDNENRFLVVLETLEALETLDGSFAYQNGNDIIVNGEGNLQIFDVMGRLIATQRVNGVETVNVSTTG